ncbi:sulfate transporter-like protein [Dinothrombium tinctorium]|uniref:Sulfate transporter-like protein n=1 Tax=Dinothrombium tinctorium TaxID=1965070 RepID=A0A3S3RV37_9ACAR|nr:sulfate transporter-like protein [Dinothrombium tinctorium]
MADSEILTDGNQIKVKMIKSDTNNVQLMPIMPIDQTDFPEDATYIENEIELNRQLNVSRQAYNLPKFNEQFVVTSREKRDPCDVGSRAMEKVKSCCTLSGLKMQMITLFPIIKWLSNYDCKKDFIADTIAGITIAIFQVPQSMGYCFIAQVPPVHGLYTSFFPALIYALMGTSRHCAVGTFAVVSLMTGTLVTQVNDERKMRSQEAVSPIDIAMTVSFLIGVYQLICGILRLGFVSVYMSEQLISGFTTAASFYVFTSQVPYLLGLKLEHHASGPLSLINSYIEFFKHASKVHFTTMGISLACCIALIFVKLYVNSLIQKRIGLNIPFPIELLLVVIGTVCSNLLDLEKKWGIKVVGTISRGLKEPSLPKWSLFRDVALKSIPLAIVAYTLTISVGKIFANRHKYTIDSNQELIALGSTNIVSSFFTCIPSAASLSRSAVQEGAGGRTQLVSLVNCIGIAFVIFFAGPLLQELPSCILASIIAVALKSLLSQVRDFGKYWQVSKIDGSIWLITFFAVIFLDVDIGLYVGLCYSLITLIYKSQRPKMYLLGSVNKSDVFVPLKKYAVAEELPNIKIYQFCGPLHFANTEYFREGLRRKTGVCVKSVIEMREKQQKQRRKQERNMEKKREQMNNGELRKRTVTIQLSGESSDSESKDFNITLPTHIIIDCSMFSYIDAAGIGQLKATVQEYEYIGIKTYLASVATHVDKMLRKDNFYTDVPPHHVYITLIDAIHHALDDQKALEGKSDSMTTVPQEDEALTELYEEGGLVDQSNDRKSDNVSF